MKIDNVKSPRAAIERRFPKVLADELLRALRCVDRLIPNPDDRPEMLARFRRNRARRIAAWGLEPNSQVVVDGLEHIPIAYDAVLHDLDSAFAKLHHYHRHPEDWASAKVAATVGSALQSQRAGRPRNRNDKPSHEDIAAFLRRRDIKNAEYRKQKCIVQDAVEHFRESGLDVSERTIRRVISDYDLGTKRKK